MIPLSVASSERPTEAEVTSDRAKLLPQALGGSRPPGPEAGASKGQSFFLIRKLKQVLLTSVPLPNHIKSKMDYLMFDEIYEVWIFNGIHLKHIWCWASFVTPSGQHRCRRPTFETALEMFEWTLINCCQEWLTWARWVRLWEISSWLWTDKKW